MRRPLLIMACSATKLSTPTYAHRLYDGPAYRVLRNSGWPGPQGPSVRVRILSAAHGIMSPWRELAPYDRLMDEARAQELADADTDELLRTLFLPVLASKRRDAFQHFPASEVFVWGGRLYRQVVQAWEERGLFSGVPGGVSYSAGGIGVQLGQLKRWLHERVVS